MSTSLDHSEGAWLHAHFRCSLCDQVAASVDLTTASLHEVLQAHIGRSDCDTRKQLQAVNELADMAYTMVVPEPARVAAVSPAGTLVINDFTGHSAAQIAHDTFLATRAAIADNNIQDLFKLRFRWAACYCPDCDSVYCESHWQLQPVYDNDGWYDCLYGLCPQGHRRVIGD